MSTGQRPGGLTALAVLNFIFGAFGALALLALAALLSSANQATKGELVAEMSKQEGSGMVLVALLLGIASVVLIIASGVGYLGMKRFLGRTLGNAYAITSLASGALGLSRASLNATNMVGLIYPVLTLILINTTFKDDLVN